MEKKIKIKEIYDHNLNFLIGSGASADILPTLELNIKVNGQRQTIETLSTSFTIQNNDYLNSLLFMYYYKTCIYPASNMDISHFKENSKKRKNIRNYIEFLNTTLKVITRKTLSEKKCNIFTTNYDNCLEQSLEQISSEGISDFVVNDGSFGFQNKILHMKNFNLTTSQTGVFGNHNVKIPQINLLHMHGSINWVSKKDQIEVSYLNPHNNYLIHPKYTQDLNNFTQIIQNENASLNDFTSTDWEYDNAPDFWKSYSSLPIVNPTKWKFHETVLEEQYYQMLRHLSYELEKKNSILITFGFSFADEHILKLVQRSLSNPHLQIFICCYDSAEKTKMNKKFNGYNNVNIVNHDNILDFTEFNKSVFSLSDQGGS